MKQLKLLTVLIFLLTVFGGCVSASGSRHPIIKERAEMMETEVRISVFVADNIDTPRLGNYNLKKGNNYLRVPIGKHILYWSKKGEAYRKEIRITDENRRFGIF